MIFAPEFEDIACLCRLPRDYAAKRAEVHERGIRLLLAAGRQTEKTLRIDLSLNTTIARNEVDFGSLSESGHSSQFWSKR
jgi:hypothetical protein